MARSKKSGGEPGTPLIIALVFFILLSIGLGVMYYLGINDTKEADKKAADAAEKSKADAKLATIAQYKVKMYRGFLGLGPAEDPPADAKDEVRAEHVKLLADVNTQITAATNKERTAFENMNKRLGLTGPNAAGFELRGNEVFEWNWPAGGALPASPTRSPLIDRMVKMVAERELAMKQASVEIGNATKEVAELQKTQAEYKAAITTLNERLAKETAALEAARAAVETEKKAAIALFETDTTKSQKDKRDADQKRDEILAKNEELERKIKQQDETIKRMSADLDESNADKKGSFARNAPHGQITARRSGGDLVEINLGSADNLKAGVTFAIQPHDAETLGLDRKRNVWERDRSGKPTRQVARSYREVPKGKIEVVRVLGANAAEARITDEEDNVRDSIMKTDLLYNPLWRKGARDRVVLYGIFDVNGDGADDVKTVATELEQRGVTVDGYYDLATRTWESLDPKNKTPGPTQGTTYAVKGWIPESATGSILVGNVAEVSQAIEAASAEVKAKGVQEVRANRFFPEIGYRLSANAGSTESVNQAAVKFVKDAPAQPMDK